MIAADKRVREREIALYFVPNFVPTTKPYCGLPVGPKLLRVSLQVSDSVQPVSRGDSWKRLVALSS